MKRFLKVLLVLIAAVLLGGIGRPAEAALPDCDKSPYRGCSDQDECAGLCNDVENCTYACSGISYRYAPPDPGVYRGCCAFTIDDTGRPTSCKTWTPWSACVGGYETRTCVAPNDYELEIQACGAASPGPGGSLPPAPSPPPGCVATNPVAPTLTSPANGATTAGLSTTLTWTQSSWGTGCPQDNHFLVFVDTAGNLPRTFPCEPGANRNVPKLM